MNNNFSNNLSRLMNCNISEIGLYWWCKFSIFYVIFSDPPGRPEITPGKALMTTGTEQKLTCEGKAGNPPAKLEWYRDSTMLSSQYTLEGDMVKAEVKIAKIDSIFFTQFRMPTKNYVINWLILNIPNLYQSVLAKESFRIKSLYFLNTYLRNCKVSK